MASRKGRQSVAVASSADTDDVTGLVGVIVADPIDYSGGDVAFRPVSLSQPLCLLPVGSIRILDLAVDFMRRGGVSKILVATRRHANTIEKHVETVLNRAKKVKAKVEVVRLPSRVTSFGDALRELEDRLAALRQDFVLMSGDSVCTFDLAKMVEVHNETKKQNPHCVMTRAFSRALTITSRYRGSEDDVAVVLDRVTKQMIAYRSLQDGRGFELKADLLIDWEGQLEVRGDLLDIGCCVCSTQILRLFAQSFDFMSIPRDLVPAILGSREVHTESIHAFILPQFPDLTDGRNSSVRSPREEENTAPQCTSSFAARASCPRGLAACTAACLQRWTHPVVVDGEPIPGQPPLGYAGHSSFRPKSQAGMGNLVVLGPLAAVLPGAKIGDSSEIQTSVIGRNCDIGVHVNIEGSILLDGVVVGKGAVLRNCLVEGGVKIGDDAVVETGCVLGRGVVIANGHTVPAGSRVGYYKRNLGANEDISSGISVNSSEAEDDLDPLLDATAVKDDEELESHTDVKLVGEGGRGIEWRDDDLLPADLMGSDLLATFKIRVPRHYCNAADDGVDDEEEEESEEESEKGTHRNGITGTAATTDDEETEAGGFEGEMAAMFRDVLKDPRHVGNLLLEIKTCRLTYHRSTTDCVRVLLPIALESVAAHSIGSKSWGPIFEGNGMNTLMKTLLNAEDEEQNLVAFDVLFTFCMAPKLPNGAVNPLCGAAKFVVVIQTFAKLEYIDHDFLPQWWQGKVREEGITEAQRKALNFDKLKMYVEWLENDDDDDSDDE